jgi:hypothetical protein
MPEIDPKEPEANFVPEHFLIDGKLTKLIICAFRLHVSSLPDRWCQFDSYS